MAYEALYRRYRPSTFADVAGQTHVVSALRNAVEGDRVGHAYLFSGPRGTGKTTSARILAKALNCTNLQGGEPCDECDSCLAFQAGGSYDLHELDAASNNGVEAMRDLIGKVALGSPGRTKVYILDEVHMLSSGAENALLKTLEEPPSHVVFVLATTEPNKVVPTIRSRTQHLEFSLLSKDEIGGLVDYVVGDAGLEVTEEDRSYVIRAGGGSARDTLSALDQVVAAGGAPQGGEHLDALFQALVDRDSGAALAAIDGATQAGRDAVTVATSLLHELRNVFLAAMRADLDHMPEAERDQATTRAASMPPARITRAIEVIGTSVIEMRQAPDPRVDLEVAIIRLTRADLDIDPAALLERIESLETQLAGGVAIATPAALSSVPTEPQHGDATQPRESSGQASAAPPLEPDGHTNDVVQAPVAEQPAAEPQVQPAPQVQTPPPQPAPAQAAPAQAPPPQQPASPQPAPPQAAPEGADGPPRGADIVRAALAEQGIRQPRPSAATPAESTHDQLAPTPASPTAGKTLADVRRERQAAAQQTGESSPNDAVAENADARRARQAAAQAAPMQTPDQQPPTDQDPSQPAHQAPPQAAQHSAPAPTDQALSAAPQSLPDQAPQPAPAPTDQALSAAPQSLPDQAPQPAPAAVEEAPFESAQQPSPDDFAGQPPTSEPVPREAEAPAQNPSAPVGALPTLAELEAAWQPALESMSGVARSRFSAGHFMETTADSVVFGLPNPVHRDRCEEIRSEVDQALATTFGRPLPLVLVVDQTEVEPDFFNTPPSGGAGAVDELAEDIREEETVDVHDLVDATDDAPSAEDRVLNTFEGSTLLEDPPIQPHDR